MRSTAERMPIGAGTPRSARPGSPEGGPPSQGNGVWHVPLQPHRRHALVDGDGQLRPAPGASGHRSCCSRRSRWLLDRRDTMGLAPGRNGLRRARGLRPRRSMGGDREPGTGGRRSPTASRSSVPSPSGSARSASAWPARHDELTALCRQALRASRPMAARAPVQADVARGRPRTARRALLGVTVGSASRRRRGHALGPEQRRLLRLASPTPPPKARRWWRRRSARPAAPRCTTRARCNGCSGTSTSPASTRDGRAADLRARRAHGARPVHGHRPTLTPRA